jgi:hypothetical protein
MDDKTRARLFEPFFTTKEQEKALAWPVDRLRDRQASEGIHRRH